MFLNGTDVEAEGAVIVSSPFSVWNKQEQSAVLKRSVNGAQRSELAAGVQQRAATHSTVMPRVRHYPVLLLHPRDHRLHEARHFVLCVPGLWRVTRRGDIANERLQTRGSHLFGSCTSVRSTHNGSIYRNFMSAGDLRATSPALILNESAPPTQLESRADWRCRAPALVGVSRATTKQRLRWTTCCRTVCSRSEFMP